MAISLKESLLVGFSDFWTRKIRSAITILGIVLGTLSIVVVMALVKGVNESTLAWMTERGGLTRLDIRRNWGYDNPNNLNAFLTLKEFELVSSLVPEAKHISPYVSSFGQIHYSANTFRGRVGGVLPDYRRIEEWNVSDGRFITDLDLNLANDVIVLGSTIKNELFGNRNALGEYVTFQDRRLMVVGIMETRFFQSQGDVFSHNQLEYLNRTAFIPLSTVINKLSAQDRIDNITFQAPDVETAREMKRKLDQILLILRNREPVMTIDFAEEQAQNMKQHTFIFQVVFFLISSISLLVGGIVITNIMLASVQERTREIGVRLAVGARRRDVFMQFLIQTIFITTIGGFLGVIAGLSLLDMISQFMKMQMIASTSMMALAVFVSAFVGLVFGIIPSIKASNLDPVKCLSYE